MADVALTTKDENSFGSVLMNGFNKLLDTAGQIYVADKTSDVEIAKAKIAAASTNTGTERTQVVSGPSWDQLTSYVNAMSATQKNSIGLGTVALLVGLLFVVRKKGW